MGNAESREVPSASRRATTAEAPHPPSSSSREAGQRSQSLTVEAGGIERGQQATEDATSQLGYWYLIKNGYNELVHLIIRPPRAVYEVSDLGPQQFVFGGRAFMRVDFTVENDRHQHLVCSHWRPVDDVVNGISEFPCVIYLHGNSSCRVEALSVLRRCLALGVTVVAFDCAGCGKSEGDYISLGYFERDDLAAVIAYLRSHAKVSTIGLWGRSMGAATALLHADRDPSIAGLVVDSAFTNLEQLVQEIVEHGRREGYTIPMFLVKIVMKFIRSSVLKRAHFDIKSLSPLEHASISYVPALFVAAKGDDFIAPHHSDQLFAAYAGDKNIVKVNGDHNSVRPQFLLDSAGIFLQAALHIDPKLILPEVEAVTSPSRNRPSKRTPWTCESPTSAKLKMMDLHAAFSGRYAKMVPRDAWSCRVCTFVNPALQMQCEMCRTLYEATNSPERPRRASSPSSIGVKDHLSADDDEENEEDIGEVDALVSSTTSLSPARPVVSAVRSP